MKQFLTLNEIDLERGNSLCTAREISQQPDVWRAVSTQVEACRKDLDSWLKPSLAKPDLRILLCGAGSSGFIGESVAAWLRVHYALASTSHVAAVSTTDLTADPLQFLRRDVPTLMISFARSGDSPESLACVELADQLLSDCRHLVFTCNPAGRLACCAESRTDAFALMMPEEANDRSFAMTSSYTAMLAACVAVFTPDQRQLLLAAKWTARLLEWSAADVLRLAQRNFHRLVVLGAGCMAGTAAEAALKCLELTAGKVVSISGTPLGFRHGPKIIIDESTVVLHLHSGNVHTRLYDHDLERELKTDGRGLEIISLSPATITSWIGMKSPAPLDDIWQSLIYVVYCQMLAFYRAWVLGIEADNPCPSGEVNRVVDGVTIHPLDISSARSRHIP